MNIVYAYCCDQLIFKEHLNVIELLSALTIVFVALGVAIYKLRKQALERERQKLEEEQQAKLLE